jgi:hypothetical protein
MRKIILIALIIPALLALNCGNNKEKASNGSVHEQSEKGKSRLVFTEYEHDFGKVTEGEKVGYVFNFENKGTGNLVISSAATTCGCTVPKFDNKPVSPGGNGKLEVVFDATGKEGIQTKTITVKSNADTPFILLKIRAEVVPIVNN